MSKKIILYFFLCWLLFFIQSNFAHSLSAIEKNIIIQVDDNNKKSLALLKKLVNINSHTLNIKGVNKVNILMAKELKKLGFKIKNINEPADMHRASTLIAERKGSKGNRLLLIGHLDTVFNKTILYGENATTAKGAGVVDDKGGMVVMLNALHALHQLKLLNDATITVVLTGDEENSGKPTTISRAPLISVAKNSDIALDFEAGANLQKTAISRRGITHWDLSLKGEGGHSSQIAGDNIGVVYEAARILLAFKTLTLSTHLSINPAIFLSGDKIAFAHGIATVSGERNQIAKNAVVEGDFRYLSEAQKNEAKEKMQSYVLMHPKNISVNLNFVDGIPPMPPTKNSEALLKILSEVSEDLEGPKVTMLDPNLRGGGDISYAAPFVKASLIGLGAFGSGMHTDNETLELATFPLASKRVAILIYRLTR